MDPCVHIDLWTPKFCAQAAGCIAVEMECVPAKVAAEISKRTNLETPM